MPIDALFDALLGRLKSSARRRAEAERRILHQTSDYGNQVGPNSSTHSAGFFNHANGFIINQPTMIENRGQIVNHMLSSGKTVLEHLAPHTIPDAAMDSSARHPPPRCHPGTRLTIGSTLEKWVHNPERQWNVIWLHGPAGTGKSAVAQTFAECCSENGRLGAAFFFSRPNNRNDPNCVVPSLAYQMAISFPEYKALMTDQLVSDPQLLHKAPRVQFRKLILEPFTILQTQGHERIREPIIIVLDGLDECHGEDAQCEIVEMIGEAVRLKKDLPILWLIVSRPEPHLKYMFSRTDFPVHCSREELAINTESRGDVNTCLRAGFAAIKAKFWDVTDPSWPSNDQFLAVASAADGFFVFASTLLKYIGDSTYADPMARLENFLSSHKSANGASSLEALDLLYEQILSEIPEDVLPITKRILSYVTHIPKLSWVDAQPSSAQAFCNFLNMSQSAFYRALRKLHSLIEIPVPEVASEYPLRFFHASFEEYLLDPKRSGKFVVERENAMASIAKSCLFWYKVDLALFHRDDGHTFNHLHQHGNLPDLKWVSPENEESISREIARFSELHCWNSCCNVSHADMDLLKQIHEFDFKHIRLLILDWTDFADWLWGQDFSSGIIRTEPADDYDLQLMRDMEIVTSGQPVNPTTLPLCLAYYSGFRSQEYFFVGYGSSASIFWLSKCANGSRIEMMNRGGPSPERAAEYQNWLVSVGWPDSENQDEEGIQSDDETSQKEPEPVTDEENVGSQWH